MDSQNRYFYWGAFYASFMLLLIVLVAYWFATRKPLHDFFSMSDDVVMSVSLVDITDVKPVKQSQENRAQDSTLAESEPQEDIDDLFDSVKASDLSYSKHQKVKEDIETVDKNFLKKINTRTKIKAQDVKLEHKKVALDLKMPVLNQQESPTKRQKRAGTKNAYFAKLYDLLYSGWEPYGYGEQLAIIIIQIHTNGRFSYEVKQWSASPLFNQTLQSYLESLRLKKFPLPEDGKSVRVKVNFISKEKNA